MTDWICKICNKKIGIITRIFRLWYDSDEYGGKVHWWCYYKPRKKSNNFELKFI